MKTTLARISQLSKENPELKFNSIGHLIGNDRKVVGIDGTTKDEYEENLDENLRNLVLRLKNQSYKPKPAKRVEISKDNGKIRPPSIYSYEDKLVQEALRKILEVVFEPLLYDSMCGFMPNRSYHGAIRKLNDMIERRKTNYIYP